VSVERFRFQKKKLRPVSLTLYCLGTHSERKEKLGKRRGTNPESYEQEAVFLLANETQDMKTLVLIRVYSDFPS